MARTAGYPKGTARRPTTRQSGTNGLSPKSEMAKAIAYGPSAGPRSRRSSTTVA